MFPLFTPVLKENPWVRAFSFPYLEPGHLCVSVAIGTVQLETPGLISNPSGFTVCLG